MTVLARILDAAACARRRFAPRLRPRRARRRMPSSPRWPTSSPRCSRRPSTRITSSPRSSSATREIDEQRRFTERIIDSLPVGLYVIDREYRIQAWNRKRETGMQGVSREEAIGRTIFDILHRQPAERAAQRVRERLRDGTDAAVPDRVAVRSARRAPIASPRFRCASTTEPRHARHHHRRRHHRVAPGAGAIRPGGEARGDRHAGRRRHARDQQSARDDRRVRREPRARID